MRGIFGEALLAVTHFAHEKGVSIILTNEFDSLFKGDLDGKNIWISTKLSEEEQLFNALHLFGHTIQWATNEEQKSIGGKLWKLPDQELLNKLVHYEWESSCYGVTILEEVGWSLLTTWLERKYREDIYSLYHYYKTGVFLSFDKIRESYEYPRSLFAKPIPYFEPEAEEKTRRGIVINFKEETA